MPGFDDVSFPMDLTITQSLMNRLQNVMQEGGPRTERAALVELIVGIVDAIAQLERAVIDVRSS